jgi:Ca-activated chloride channel family protein
VATSQVDVTEIATDLPALKALFGARRLLGLEYLINARYSDAMLREQLKRMGYDPKEIVQQAGTSVYAENALKAAQEALNPLLVRESLRYGVACAETAFVAVRKEAGEPVEARVIVPNALPSGWSEDFLSLGAGAAAPRGPAVLRSFGPTMVADVAGSGTVKAMAQPLAEGRLRQRSDTEVEAEEAVAPGPRAGTIVIFAGAPIFERGQAVLFDTTQRAGRGKLPDQATLSRIAVEFKAKDIAKDAVRGLRLLIFVGDMALPRATIRLADLLRGARPLNLRKRAGEAVRVVLRDPEGAWASQSPPAMTVRLTTK